MHPSLKMYLAWARRLSNKYGQYKVGIFAMLLFLFILRILFWSSSSGSNDSQFHRRKYSVHGKRVDSGYLKHVYKVFSRLGYDRTDIEDHWDILWSHDYPFNVMRSQLEKITPSQMVNHIPGSGYFTNKMNLATMNMVYIPKAFKLPQDLPVFHAYKRKNPKSMFILKSNNHRGIRIIENLPSNVTNQFAQVYVQNPLLVDGHKFDIGVYTFVTSLDPLRIYTFSDVLFRFCPMLYEPFDAAKLDKYVVGDDYLPLWRTKLNKYYSNGYGMKASFDAYLKSIGKEPATIWSQVDDAIRSILLEKEPSLILAKNKFKHGRFFEMVRFDFVIDADLNVFVMEANMSPNLSSAHFPPNQELYEQVLYSLFSTVGLQYGPSSHAKDLELTVRQLTTNAVTCTECMGCGTDCAACPHCISEVENKFLNDSILEHNRRVNNHRVFPPSGRDELKFYDSTGLSRFNNVLVQWFKFKCEEDARFCQ